MFLKTRLSMDGANFPNSTKLENIANIPQHLHVYPIVVRFNVHFHLLFQKILLNSFSTGLLKFYFCQKIFQIRKLVFQKKYGHTMETGSIPDGHVFVMYIHVIGMRNYYRESPIDYFCQLLLKSGNMFGEDVQISQS